MTRTASFSSIYYEPTHWVVGSSVLLDYEHYTCFLGRGHCCVSLPVILLLLCNNRELAAWFLISEHLWWKEPCVPLHTDICHSQKAQFQDGPKASFVRAPRPASHFWVSGFSEEDQTLKSKTIIFWTISVTKWAFERWYIISLLFPHHLSHSHPHTYKTKQDGGHDELVWSSLKSECCLKDGSCHSSEQKLSL